LSTSSRWSSKPSGNTGGRLGKTGGTHTPHTPTQQFHRGRQAPGSWPFRPAKLLRRVGLICSPTNHLEHDWTIVPAWPPYVPSQPSSMRFRRRSCGWQAVTCRRRGSRVCFATGLFNLGTSSFFTFHVPSLFKGLLSSFLRGLHGGFYNGLLFLFGLLAFLRH
jgi:hypothetical protein